PRPPFPVPRAASASPAASWCPRNPEPSPPPSPPPPRCPARGPAAPPSGASASPASAPAPTSAGWRDNRPAAPPDSPFQTAANFRSGETRASRTPAATESGRRWGVGAGRSTAQPARAVTAAVAASRASDDFRGFMGRAERGCERQEEGAHGREPEAISALGGPP